MAYLDALKAIQKRQSEFDDYTHAMQNNKFMSKLNFDPKMMLGLGLAGSGTRMAAAAGQGDIGVNDPSWLADMGPYAGAAMMGVLPLRMLSQAHQKRKRETELQTQKELADHSPGSIGVGDVTKSLGAAAGNVSNTAMNTYMTMMAMGTLGGVMGIDGSAAWSKAALVPYGLSGATGGPLRAASAYMGFGGLESMIKENPALTSANESINPITGGLTSLPWLVGKGAASGLSGLGGLMTDHSTNAAVQSAGGLLSGAGSGVSGISDSFLNAALDGSAGGSMMGMAGGIGTMMLLKPLLNKVGTFLKENVAPSTGNALLKSGSIMRPRVQMAGQLIKKYSKTVFLDTQTSQAGQQGQLKTAEWLTLSYLGAIEKSVSLIGFITEYIQDIQNGKSTSGHMAQNKIQSHYGHSGISSIDLTQRWSNPEDEIDSLRGPAKLWAQTKYSALQGANLLGRASEIGSSFMTPTDWLSQENNPMARMRRMREGDRLNQTIAAVSRSTGIPTSFLTALETTATSLADMGETAEDKQVTLLGGIHELVRFSAFQLKDIAGALGVTEAQSYMNKISNLMAEAEGQTGEQDESMASKFGKWMAGSKIASIGAAGLGAAVAGPLGLYAGMVPGMIGGAYETFQHSKLNKWFSGRKTFSTAINDLEDNGEFDTTLGSADASLEALTTEGRRETFYDNVALIARIMEDCHDCDKRKNSASEKDKAWREELTRRRREREEQNGGLWGIIKGVVALGAVAAAGTWMFKDSEFGNNEFMPAAGQGILTALSLFALGVPLPLAMVGGAMLGLWSGFGDKIKEKLPDILNYGDSDWKTSLSEGMLSSLLTSATLMSVGVPIHIALALGAGAGVLVGLGATYGTTIKEKVMSFGDSDWKTSLSEGVMTGLLTSAALLKVGVPMHIALGLGAASGAIMGIWAAYGDDIKEKLTTFGDSDWKTSLSEGVMSGLLTAATLMSVGVPPHIALALGAGAGVVTGVWAAYGDDLKEFFTSEKENNHTAAENLGYDVPDAVSRLQHQYDVTRKKFIDEHDDVIGDDYIFKVFDSDGSDTGKFYGKPGKEAFILNNGNMAWEVSTNKLKPYDKKKHAFIEQQPEEITKSKKVTNAVVKNKENYDNVEEANSEKTAGKIVNAGKPYVTLPPKIQDTLTILNNDNVEEANSEKTAGKIVNAGKQYVTLPPKIQDTLTILNNKEAPTQEKFIMPDISVEIKTAKDYIDEINKSQINQAPIFGPTIDSSEIQLETNSLLRSISDNTVGVAQITTAQQNEMITSLYEIAQSNSTNSQAIAIAIASLGESIKTNRMDYREE